MSDYAGSYRKSVNGGGEIPISFGFLECSIEKDGN